MKQPKIIFIFIAILMLSVLTSPKDDNKYFKDFLEFWTDIKSNYAYFDKKNTDWHKVKTIYLPPQAKLQTLCTNNYKQ